LRLSFRWMLSTNSLTDSVVMPYASCGIPPSFGLWNEG
jgi:hypothetical protein